MKIAKEATVKTCEKSLWTVLWV